MAFLKVNEASRVKKQKVPKKEYTSIEFTTDLSLVKNARIEGYNYS